MDGLLLFRCGHLEESGLRTLQVRIHHHLTIVAAVTKAGSKHMIETRKSPSLANWGLAYCRSLERQLFSQFLWMTFSCALPWLRESRKRTFQMMFCIGPQAGGRAGVYCTYRYNLLPNTDPWRREPTPYHQAQPPLHDMLVWLTKLGLEEC